MAFSVTNKFVEQFDAGQKKIAAADLDQNFRDVTAAVDGLQTDVNAAQAAANSNRRNIGELVHSLVPLDDASLHLLDGTLLAADGMYAAGIAKIAALQTDHPGLFVTEADWQAGVAAYGACGKFVYDATAGTLRLPKVTGFMEATIDASALGDLVEAGLPNITGTIIGRKFSTGAAFVGGDGKLFVASSSGSPVSAVGASGTADVTSLGLDASRSNPIYGNSATVQPQSIKGFVYMVLANTVKAPVVVDIDEVASDLNLKAGVDLANVNSTGQAAMAHAAMPSGQYIDLTLPASGGTVTAPADGWIELVKLAANTEYIQLFNGSNKYLSQSTGQNNYLLSVHASVSSGDVVKVSYNATGATQYFVFIYANGSIPA